MFVVPTIEERLRSSLVLCQTLKHCTCLADQRPILVVPAFTSRKVLRLLQSAMDALSDQLTATAAALPPDSLNTGAPLVRSSR